MNELMMRIGFPVCRFTPAGNHYARAVGRLAAFGFNFNFPLPPSCICNPLPGATANADTNKVTIPAGQPNIDNGEAFAVFNAAGAQVASGTYNAATGNTVTPSPALVADEHLALQRAQQGKLVGGAR